MNENNIAFIDGQNFFLGIRKNDLKIDFKKFRIYLRDKYKVEKAYYFLGFLDENLNDLYTKLQESGFIVEFREHNSKMKGKKKGNVDVDLVFSIMKKLSEEKDKFDKIVVVSSDGDYIKLIKYLIEKDKLKKIIFPTNKPSSLYNKIDIKFKSRIKDSIEKFEVKKSKKNG